MPQPSSLPPCTLGNEEVAWCWLHVTLERVDRAPLLSRPVQRPSCLRLLQPVIFFSPDSSPFLSLGGHDLHPPPGMGTCAGWQGRHGEWFRDVTTCRPARGRLKTLLEPLRKGHSLWVLLVAILPPKQRAYLERESKLRGGEGFLLLSNTGVQPHGKHYAWTFTLHEPTNSPCC